MVDTINPNTSQPDSWGDSSAPVAPASSPEDRFFGGFDQPGDTKINLAGSQQDMANKPVDVTPQAAEVPVQEAALGQSEPAAQAVSDVAAPITPAEAKHTTYTNTSDLVNWRGILVIVAIGLVATAVVGAGLYFGLSAMNSSKLKSQEEQLSSIQSQLNALEETPSPLELPVTETPVEEEIAEEPVTVPVVVPVETPVEVPATAPTEEVDKLG